MAVVNATEKTTAALSADWALARGVNAMSTSEIATLIGSTPLQVPQRLAAPMQRLEWISPARGLYIPVAPENRGRGGPPATEFIAALAAHFGIDYYIGWLSAAATYGAAHQAPQVTHIATSGLVRDRQIGRARLRFHRRVSIADLPINERHARASRYHVSTPEVTAFDIATDLAFAGGVSNAATVIADLAEETGLDDDALVAIALYFNGAAARRVGWIVEQFTDHRLDALNECCSNLSAKPSLLHPTGSPSGSLNKRWNLRINQKIEVE